jgi:hypothetical protein
MTNLYGFESTDDVQYDKAGLPLGIAKFLATSEEPAVKDGITTGIIVTYECVEGDNKGRSGRVWYNTLHSNPKVANIAKQQLKRISDATKKPISETSPIKGRVITLDVVTQKKNPEYTEIKRYLPEDYKPEDSAPF